VVVAYDDFNTTYATRLWWVLDYYGHTNAEVLKDGWHRWLTEGRPATLHETTPQPGQFTPRPDGDVMCRLDYLKERFDDPDVQVLNVLPEAHFRARPTPR